MNNNIQQLKQSIINELKFLSLDKKNREFLLALIELFDWLSENEEERFLPKLEKLIAENNLKNDEELKIRLKSLQIQLESNQTTKIIKFSTFSIYFQNEKVKIYLKKLPSTWDNLIEEIQKINFNSIFVDVFKSVTKKEKIITTRLKKNEWKEELIKILDENIYSNITITLQLNKKQL